MKRRHFLRSTSSALAMIPLYRAPMPSLPDDLLAALVRHNDTRVASILSQQMRDESHDSFGGFPDQYDIFHPITPAAYSRDLVAAYISPESRYYHQSEIEQCLNLGLQFLLERQHPDGTIDLLSTNFHSPPDTAFAVEPLALALGLVRTYIPQHLPEFQSQAEQFLLQAGPALAVGGIHTPNHRWVVCRALARIHNLYPNADYVDRIDEWLNEKIDIDPDGQYTERSVVAYTPLTNDCLITIARLMGRDELYEPIRKNLGMLPYLLHANGEVVTEASRRQDQFQIAKAGRYFYSTRYMARLDKNAEFSSLNAHILASVGEQALSGSLPYLLEDDTLKAPLTDPSQLPSDYAKHFPHSGMVRVRRGSMDATVLSGNSIFFTLFNGDAALQAIRMASAFFGKGQFETPTIKIEDGQYVLVQDLVGPYYQPHDPENLSEDGNWEDMPRKLRRQSEIQSLTSTITITEESEGFRLHFATEGTERIPVSIELAFRSGGTLSGVVSSGEEGSWFLEDEVGMYASGGDQIRFGPGMREHSWRVVRGAQEKLNGDSVYLTGYTPLDFDLMVGR